MNMRSLLLGLSFLAILTPQHTKPISSCAVDISARLAYLGLITYITRPSTGQAALGLFVVPMLGFAFSGPIWEDIVCMVS